MYSSTGGVGEGPTILAQKEWKAYPKFAPPEKFAPFVSGHVDIPTRTATCCLTRWYDI